MRGLVDYCCIIVSLIITGAFLHRGTRPPFSLNALFYLDCIRAWMIKLTLLGRPHAIWGHVTTPDHRGSWRGGGTVVCNRIEVRVRVGGDVIRETEERSECN